ncbi:HNH endonuclease [bacterium]|nr:HNH endonuclease [bacterium]
MKRRFSKYQRKLLKIIAGNTCGICKQTLCAVFHADHMRPHSKGGDTTLTNGQALCPDCNLKKGARL